MPTRMVSQKFDTEHHFSKKRKTGITDSSLHWHDCYELDIILSGSGTMVCNGHTYEIQRGLASLLSPADFHEYRHCRDLDVLCIQFTEENIDNALLGSNIGYVDEKTLRIMLSLCDLLGELASDRFNILYDSRLIECLITAFSKCCTEENSKAGRQDAIQKVIVYLNAHFRENPKMSEIAQMVHLSDAYFCRLFKQCVGVSYKNYLKKLKLECSYKLLKNTDLSIIDIASSCGYETQSHFNREFKQYFHVAPHTIR